MKWKQVSLSYGRFIGDTDSALLVVSDNSATGAALVGRTDEEQSRYD